MTWEKGKEHNIVLGGNGIVKNWTIQLKSNGDNPLNFSMSREDSRGFVVYSVIIPDDYPDGIYTIETDSSKEGKKVVAGVRIVEISNYNLVQIPTKLFTILITLILLLSTLSILRMKKYDRIEYLRAKLSPSPSGLLGILYRFRESSIEEIHRSLFKFQLIREGELLHKFSPSAWALLPWVALFLGGVVSASQKVVDGVSLTPVLVYGAIALIGVLDPFSGFVAGIGFALVHLTTGSVSSVRGFMALVAITVGWFAPGIISSLYSDALNKDHYPVWLKKFLPDVLASIVGGLVFFAAELLTNSFADHQGPISANGYLIPTVLTLFIFVRISSEKFLNKDLHQTGENYQIRTLALPRVISPRTILFAAGFFSAALYVWTESISFSLQIGVLLALPMTLLMVRFENPVVPFLRNYDRNIFFESLAMISIALVVFNYIQGVPMEVTQKGRMFIGYSAVLLLVHGIFSSIVDSSHRTREKKGMELVA